MCRVHGQPNFIQAYYYDSPTFTLLHAWRRRWKFGSAQGGQTPGGLPSWGAKSGGNWSTSPRTETCSQIMVSDCARGQQEESMVMVERCDVVAASVCWRRVDRLYCHPGPGYRHAPRMTRRNFHHHALGAFHNRCMGVACNTSWPQTGTGNGFHWTRVVVVSHSCNIQGPYMDTCGHLIIIDIALHT